MKDNDFWKIYLSKLWIIKEDKKKKISIKIINILAICYIHNIIKKNIN